MEELKINVPSVEEVSDGFHTFKELYEYRKLYNAAFFNELHGRYDVHKSRRHSDGKYPFDNNDWFIVMAELPSGQISNHYEMKDWNLFNIPEKERANKWDGHSPRVAAIRLSNFLINKCFEHPQEKLGELMKNLKDLTIE